MTEACVRAVRCGSFLNFFSFRDDEQAELWEELFFEEEHLAAQPG